MSYCGFSGVLLHVMPKIYRIIHTGTYILYVIQPSEQTSSTYFHQATKRQNAETWQANREAAFFFIF